MILRSGCVTISSLRDGLCCARPDKLQLNQKAQPFILRTARKTNGRLQEGPAPPAKKENLPPFTPHSHHPAPAHRFPAMFHLCALASVLVLRQNRVMA